MLLIVILFTVISSACDTTNDPMPNGGSNCTNDLDCNSVNQAGVCNFFHQSAGNCVCNAAFGKPDCSYARTSKDMAGGLQIGLLFVGAGGVGNFVIGRTGHGVGQLMMYTFGIVFLIIAICIGFCCMAGSCEGCGYAIMIASLVIFIIAIIAAFIWTIVDGANMLNCVLPDSNGYALF